MKTPANMQIPLALENRCGPYGPPRVRIPPPPFEAGSSRRELSETRDSLKARNRAARFVGFVGALRTLVPRAWLALIAMGAVLMLPCNWEDRRSTSLPRRRTRREGGSHQPRETQRPDAAAPCGMGRVPRPIRRGTGRGTPSAPRASRRVPPRRRSGPALGPAVHQQQRRPLPSGDCVQAQFTGCRCTGS
jgi:hypothetical protein